MISALSIAAGVAIGLTLLLYFAQERLLFHPQPAPAETPRAAGLSIETISVPVGDGLSLRGWLARPEGTSGRLPLVLYFGGNAEEVSGMSTLAARFPGWALLTVNYRGYGGNPGEPSERALVADALAIHDWAAKRADVDAARIAVIGRSLGSGVAVQLAAARPVVGLVLVTPYDSLRAVAQRIYPFMPVGLLLRHPFESIAFAARITAPTLMLAAGRDEVIPPDHARTLHAAWSGPKQWLELPGAGHNDLDAEPDYWKVIADFLAAATNPAFSQPAR